jgi:mycoredoxin
VSLRRRLFGRPDSLPHAEAFEQAQRGVAIYWRPGCTFCAVLTNSVRRYADHAAWVNIWKDPDAAAYVRGVNGGNETVPTVVIDGVAHTNPAPLAVRKALRALA